MSAFDKNKIFFALVHYILSEQQNVDWILKTSLVNFTGLNTTISNKKFKQNSVTDDIIDYIYQIKPYHVQFEQFIEKYSSQQDDVNVSPSEESDITFEIRFDAVTSKVDEQSDMSDIDYMNTHMANRLWFFKHKVFDEKEMDSFINDVLNCHSKGITVDGADMNMDTAGYDAFLYDEKLYDAPTISNEYCFIDNTEDLHYDYIKSFVKVGLKTLQIHETKDVLQGNCTCKYYYNGESGDVNGFSISGNMVSIYRPIRQYEKIVVTSVEKTKRKAYIFVGHPFMESERADESNFRKFTQVGTTRFPIPDGNLGSKKVTAYIIHPNGSKIPYVNFYREGSEIIVGDDFKENYRLQITVIDYRRVYDKIYTYEDAYGQSNNIITLDGDAFLRPYYEKERPEELTVIYPISNLMVYTQNKNTMKTLLNINWKNDQLQLPLTKSMSTTLVKELNIGDKTIEVESSEKLYKPSKTATGKIIPGKILINSELIEYHDYEKRDDKTILKGIRRAANGTVLWTKHPVGETVYAYNENSSKDCSPTSVYITTQWFKGMENKFIVPNDYKSDDKIIVFKKSNVKLLTDITFKSEYFDIDSNNIHLPTDDEMGYLYINDDKIFFKTIEQISEGYRIRDFFIGKEYKKNNALIYGFNYEEVPSNNYEIVVNQAYEERAEKEGEIPPYDIAYRDVYVKFKVEPEPYEVIVVGNEK